MSASYQTNTRHILTYTIIILIPTFLNIYFPILYALVYFVVVLVVVPLCENFLYTRLRIPFSGLSSTVSSLTVDIVVFLGIGIMCSRLILYPSLCWFRAFCDFVRGFICSGESIRFIWTRRTLTPYSTYLPTEITIIVDRSCSHRVSWSLLCCFGRNGVYNLSIDGHMRISQIASLASKLRCKLP